MYRLTFLNGKFKGKRLTVQQGALLIGRDPECQVDLDDDDEVSRHHALIEIRGGSPVIRDLGSTNPVQVNEQPVKEHRLRSGDRIEIGRTILEFQSGSSSAPPRHRRRFSKMQATSFAAIALIVLLQVVFVILFPLWQKKETVPVDMKAAKKPPVVASESASTTSDTASVTSVPEAVAAVTSVAKTVASTVAATEVPDPESVEAEDFKIPASLTSLVAAVAASRSNTGMVVASQGELPPAVPAPAMDTTPSGQVEDVVALRTEIEDLRRQVESIAVPVKPTEQVAKELSKSAPDPLLEKSREMLAEAQREIERMNYFQADNLLDRITMMSPDFIPAYRERAVLFEKRGMLKQAGEQWQRVMKLTAGSPLYEQAAAERQRIARLEMTQKTVSGPELTRTSTTSQRLEKRIRIVSVERERFRANEEYDEMRLIRITLRPRNNEREVNADQVQLVVVFYDRVIGADRVVPTRALVPEDSLRITGSWAAGEARSVSAAYIVGKGFREQEEQMLGEKREYEGYRVMIYYQGKLQDESAMPARILDMERPPVPGSR